MKIVINGEDRAFEGALTLNALVEKLGMKTDRVAVELNREIVPREEWSRTELAEGDRLEIVHFVGGGSGCITHPGRGQVPTASAALDVGVTRRKGCSTSTSSWRRLTYDL
jgi:sulfur carrier protein